MDIEKETEDRKEEEEKHRIEFDHQFREFGFASE